MCILIIYLPEGEKINPAMTTSSLLSACYTLMSYFYSFILNVYHLFFLKPEHNSILLVGLEHLHKSLVTKTNQERSKCLTALGIKQCFPSHLDESVKKGKTDKLKKKKLKY